MPTGENSSQFSAEEYFATQPPPASLEQDVARVRDFVARQKKAGRKVALVTVRDLRSYIISKLKTRRAEAPPCRLSSMCERTLHCDYIAELITARSQCTIP